MRCFCPVFLVGGWGVCIKSKELYLIGNTFETVSKKRVNVHDEQVPWKDKKCLLCVYMSKEATCPVKYDQPCVLVCSLTWYTTNLFCMLFAGCHYVFYGLLKLFHDYEFWKEKLEFLLFYLFLLSIRSYLW